MTFLIFLGVLSVLVLIHEFGHFAAAKIFGIKVEEFALGLPFTRAIYQIKTDETVYSIYPLLFGGFVKLYGEEQQSKQDVKRSFWERGKKQRMLVLAAGIFMNIVLAFGLFTALYMAVGVPGEIKEYVTIDAVQDGSPAEKAGIKVGDRVTSVNKVSELQLLTKANVDKNLSLSIRRGETIALFEGIVEKNSQELIINVIPKNGVIGVSIGEYPYVTTTQCPMTNVQCPIRLVAASVKATSVWGARILDGFRSIGQSLMAGKKPEGVAGPIGIYQLTGLVAGEGFLPLMELVAILSLNLAIFNILPIPALDGGRMFFVWLEWVRKKRVTPALEAKINAYGMAVLLALMALISLQDVIRIWWR